MTTAADLKKTVGSGLAPRRIATTGRARGRARGHRPAQGAGDRQGGAAVCARQRDAGRRRAREFAEAFNAVQREMAPVRKLATNSHTKSTYARLEDVARMLDPIILAHGFSRSLSTTDSPTAGHLRFALVLRHVSGHEERHHLDAPVDDIGIQGKAGTKTALHGMASSYTYCERHLLCKVFGVQVVSDDDGNAAAGVGPSAEKHQ